MRVRSLLTSFLFIATAPALAEDVGKPMGKLLEQQAYVYAWKGMMAGEAAPFWIHEYAKSLDGPPTFERTDLDVEWVASSVQKLSVIAGRELPDHALQLKARLVGTRDVMTMQDFEMTFGESDLQGQFTMRAGEIPAVDIDVQSTLF